MRLPKCKEQIVARNPEIARWQERSPVERRTDHDIRRKKSEKYFKSGGQERRTGKSAETPRNAEIDGCGSANGAASPFLMDKTCGRKTRIFTIILVFYIILCSWVESYRLCHFYNVRLNPIDKFHKYI